jgi:hypothetical protein
MSTYLEVLINLISFMARGGTGQGRIAQKLNDRKLHQPDSDTRWNQTAVARFMVEHGIQPGNKAPIQPKAINYNV